MKLKKFYILALVAPLLLLCSCKREYCDDFTSEQLSFFPYHEGQILKFYNKKHDSTISIQINKVQINKSREPLFVPEIGCSNELYVYDKYNLFTVHAVYTESEGFGFYYSLNNVFIYNNSEQFYKDSLLLGDTCYRDLFWYKIEFENMSNFKRSAIKKNTGLYLIELFDSSIYELQ